MADKIRKRIKEEFDAADTVLEKAKVAAKLVAAGPVVVPAVAVEAAADIAKDVPDKVKEANQKAQLKKYNPLFWEDYTDPEFNCPNLVAIADDAERRDIEVCQGAIGWRSIENGVEVLHLYDNMLDSCGLNFIPGPICDAVYYVNSHQKNAFINIEDLYETIQQQKLAELSRVAYSLGAKYYSIEIIEEEKETKKKEGKAGVKAKAKKIADGQITIEASENTVVKHSRKAFRQEEFTKTRNPVVPVLNWYKDDHNILGLIDAVCNGDGSMKKSDIQIECSKSAVMAKALAGKIDVAVKKMGIGTTTSLKSEAESEFASKIIFHVEF